VVLTTGKWVNGPFIKFIQIKNDLPAGRQGFRQYNNISILAEKINFAKCSLPSLIKEGLGVVIKEERKQFYSIL
jgi:hypothetical protein